MTKYLPLLLLLLCGLSAAAQMPVTGTVKDQNGDAIAGANVIVRGASGRGSIAVTTNRDGEFTFRTLAPGTYKVRVIAPGFAAAEREVAVGTEAAPIDFNLEIGEAHATVTAEVGQLEETKNVAQPVSVISANEIAQRATSVLAQAGEEEAGLNVQRTSPTLGAIVVRGLTGKNVVNFVDGVRFTHAGQRGGINTFFNLNEANNFQAIEVLRGPNGAQYGSDSLAGTVNLISKSPAFGTDKGELHGEFNPSFTSADRSFGSGLLLSYGTQRFGGYVNLSARRVNDLRTAGGIDTHSAITRFLGLPSTILYDVNPETSFTQYGGSTKLSYAPREDKQLIFFYQRGHQDGGKRFDQLIGGDGNLIADLRNLMLDFGYLRYVDQGFGPFDSGSFTVSYNSQREERVNQGGQGNPFGDITHQYERTSTWGSSFFLDKRIGSNTFLVGGDYYREGLNSPAYTHNPVANTFVISRPRVPDEARFTSAGVYIQDQWEAVRDRLRITGSLRYS